MLIERLIKKLPGNKKNGFEFLHFYTLNQSELALSVCKKLNIGYL